MSIFDFFTREAGQERRRALEGLLTQFIPPEMRPQLGLLAEAQPIRGAERAGQGAVRVMNTQGMDRVQAIGDTLSEMAGVVAPAMVAGRAGVPVANAVQDVLTGYSPMVQYAGGSIIDRLNQPGPVPEYLNMFAGPRAQTADVGLLNKAQEMLADEATADDIWSQTGWFRGADGKWRFEISDKSASLANPSGATLGDVLSHEELFSAYPALRSIPVNYSENVGWQGFPEGANSLAGIDVTARADDAVPVFLHEIQHNVQGIEDFSRGGSPLMFYDPQMRALMLPGEDELSAYKRLAGEVEAREVEKRFRRDMSNIRPGVLTDVPAGRQIIQNLLSIGPQ